ncbi:uncharacterized protein J7T54_002744 [Emericellopsis cladophorae]|uniref:FAD-binding PCMH-type domain-containing protein n=1 Tax=Emericellopsis cladophorae TaxID=2686198 RepID=A0A9P9XU25_9HYPO|nr:uncharacterized protein J7T54_002744 [Emericellopsis cladophorae]KAI6777823.1 hypothetical protein J7T54_002744 [Emericellopsis cladophorae]
MASHRTASFPSGVVRVADSDEALDCFTPFIAGFSMPNLNKNKTLKAEWRSVCRALGHREKVHPDHLLFSAPDVMLAFTRHATTLPDLMAQVPFAATGDVRVKNREACLHHAALVVRPTEIRHIQRCVQWALTHSLGLTVLGGGHSGHCLWPNVVSVDMGAFDKVHVLTGKEGGAPGSNSGPLVVAETGCKSGDIVRKAMAAGVTVPLGARPSVGAGLWLQGGIGHLARVHGLSCDAIVGAVVVSVASSQILCVGQVPSQHRPAVAVHPENEADMLWAMKGAGTNFGIVVSVTFKTYSAPTYSIRNWVVPLSDTLEARLKLSDFDELVARKLPRNISVDAYLYWETDKLRLGVTMFESSTPPGLTAETPTPKSRSVDAILGLEGHSKTVDGVGLFEAEMYISGMHGGHAGGKTSSFKRCLFLKRIGAANVADILVAAVATRPSPLCYLHLLQGGGAVGDIAAATTAFGCRDWDFACVITGVWLRDQDDSEIARAAVQWVYNVARNLLPLSSGAYAADLGPDPRDAKLAAEVFGRNGPRLARLKRSLDPGNVLAYACPLPKAPVEPKLIILVTGESCAGKDYCADIWVPMFAGGHKDIKARAVSISDAIKAEYAAANGADLRRLLCDRAYKELHRSALSKYFQAQVKQRPRLPEEHFLNVLDSAVEMDVLFITGMRDEAPVAALSHLVPDSRLLEVRIEASAKMRQIRRGSPGGADVGTDNSGIDGGEACKDCNSRPSLIFSNETIGTEGAKTFCESFLLPFINSDLQQLASMVRPVPNFPRTGVDFRHVLDICQQPGGLALSTALFQSHFTGDWAKVDAVACCEIGGLVYASALAAQVGVPLALIREAGKLPPPTISVAKDSSHISSQTSRKVREKRIEMGRDVLCRGASVVVVDDVLATGNTLYAVLQLLRKAGIDAEDVNVMVVAEFPSHRGRDLLRRQGFGGTKIQSLLVFGGA